jgi:hypothetical protein
MKRKKVGIIGTTRITHCRAKDCCRVVQVQKHQLCNAHYVRMLRHGTIGKAPLAVRKKHAPYKGKYS